MSVLDNCTSANGTTWNYIWLNPNVTTASNPDPYAWTFSMMLSVFAAIVFTYMYPIETTWAFGIDFSQLHDTSAKVEKRLWVDTMRPIEEIVFTWGFLITFTGYTMYLFYQLTGSNFTETQDMTSEIIIWFAFANILAHKISAWASELERVRMKNARRVELFHSVKVLRNRSDRYPDERGKNEDSLDTKYVTGTITRVHMATRAFIIVWDTLTWASIPLVMAWCGARYNSEWVSGGPAVQAKMEVGQKYVVPGLATFYFVIQFAYMLVVRGAWIKQGLQAFWSSNIKKLSRNHSLYAIQYDHRKPLSDINQLRIGHSGDVLGDGSFVRGEIHTNYISSTHMITRILLMAACASIVYVDTAKTMAFVMCVEVLPLFMTVFAQNNQYFIAYETAALFWFNILSYFWGMYSTENKCNVTQHLLTLLPAGQEQGPVRLLWILAGCMLISYFIILGEESVVWEMGRAAPMVTGELDDSDDKHYSTDIPLGDDLDEVGVEENQALVKGDTSARRRHFTKPNELDPKRKPVNKMEQQMSLNEI